ncbi:hypothetical protein C7H19_18740 [Aphanothece hegewaldii CCALA 016]|uniref:Uncharacterized protein n=1 Tax=Aphanothece hegewaldii CCALA 016 TaxID=2107694 RepID=A0A2T1LTN0_9CHRO|nr:hypothetical protein [Aphanothece hegewaldii]PSF34467.1 hypothetical protein C7H19_18740 [Aphanothece hegewaldii CCALA 016]
MLVNSLIPQAVRNYVMISASVVVLSMGLTDVFYSPQRMGQQDRIDNYSNYIKAGMVAATKTSLKSAQ